MKKTAEKLMAVYTHTGSNLIDKKRVEDIYSKNAMQKNIDRLLFSKQRIFASNSKKLLQIKIVY